ncbi:MAG: FUSC family protein [Candidatus Acidiferrales bacterium]
MVDAKHQAWPIADKREALHAARTAVTAVASLLLARLLRLPEAYWAAITSMIVMQSTLGAAWTVSKQRLAGTAVGAILGALLATYAGSNWAVFGASVFLAGMVCTALHMGRNAFRYSGITLVVVMLVARNLPMWEIAAHRFVEISLGIAVGLAITAAWPETTLAES